MPPQWRYNDCYDRHCMLYQRSVVRWMSCNHWIAIICWFWMFFIFIYIDQTLFSNFNTDNNYCQLLKFYQLTTKIKMLIILFRKRKETKIYELIRFIANIAFKYNRLIAFFIANAINDSVSQSADCVFIIFS